MNKNIYIAPQIEVIEIENASMLAASAEDIPVVKDESGAEILSNRRRGTWGNLWATEED